jgi:hypothetical protein
VAKVNLPLLDPRLRHFIQGKCWRCILVHLACSLHFGLDLIMELTRH